MHVKEQPEPVEHFRPDVPPQLASILLRLMAKRPRHRYQEPSDLLGALLPLLQSSWHGPAVTIHDKAGKTSVRLKPVTTPILQEEGEPTTLVVTPSEMDIYLPETLNTTLPSSRRESWFRPLQMGIAIVMATLAMIVLQVTSPRKAPKTPVSVQPISTTSTDPGTCPASE
jgi:hypothetical protein